MRTFALLAACLMTAPAFAQQASVAGTDGTNALGTVPCAGFANDPLGDCPAELLRKGEGKATLRVLLPGGRSRSLYFEGGEVTSADSTDPVRGGSKGGIYYIFVGDGERFEVPTAALQ